MDNKFFTDFSYGKILGNIPLFNPKEGKTIVEPLGSGPGWWAGAPSAIYDEEKKRFYLYYRLRKPIELGRGGECRIDESEDGVSFKTIWAAAKEQFDSLSIERSALIKDLSGKYRLYVSYVDSGDSRWRIDMLRADSPEKLDPSSRVKVLTPDEVGTEGVKDPVVLIIGSIYHMFCNFVARPEDFTAEMFNRMHGEGNAFVSAIVKPATGLALSVDGINFWWQGEVLSPGKSWDAVLARLTSIIYNPPVFTVFYDGRPNVKKVYEDKTGMAISFDLKNFLKISESRPLLTSPHSSGSLRYLDALPLKDKIYYYYEYAREDGSHELRLNIVQR